MVLTPRGVASLLATMLVGAAKSTFAHESSAQDRVPLRQWKMQSGCKVQATGEVISLPSFKTTDWHAVEVPSTVVAALVADHSLPDPFVGTNILKLPGYSNKYDFSNFEMPDGSPYRCAWWYRTDFPSPPAFTGRNTWLHFDGINYRANIWLNGVKLADFARCGGSLPRV